MGSQQVYNYARKFGFGIKTGVALPSETSGLLRNYNKWDKLSGPFGNEQIAGSYLQRFGILDTTSLPNGDIIWIHAASVGEVFVAAPLIKSLLVQYPKFKLVDSLFSFNSSISFFIEL